MNYRGVKKYLYTLPVLHRYFTDTSLSIGRLLVEQKASDMSVDVSVYSGQ